MSQTNAERRRARKRAKIPIAGGGYTSPRRARQYIEEGRATVTPAGELEFLIANPRHVAVLGRLIVHPPDDGVRFRWHAGMSDGYQIMKGRAGLEPQPISTPTGKDAADVRDVK